MTQPEVLPHVATDESIDTSILLSEQSVNQLQVAWGCEE